MSMEIPRKTASLFILNIIIVFIVAVRGVSYGAEEKIDFGQSELSVLSGDHRYKFDIEVATTFEQHARGLMFRKTMAARHGMLFLFTENQLLTMWMKNTYIPLDIIFIDHGGVIVHIARDAVPLSLDYISSGESVIAVLELNAGVSDRLEIRVGDRIAYPFFVHRD